MLTYAFHCAIIVSEIKRTQKEIVTMTYTYKAYILNKDIEKYRKDITIIAREQMDLGAMVTFTTENEKVLDEIFPEI